MKLGTPTKTGTASRTPWRVFVDCRITRRKHYHLVMDDKGEITFKAKLFGDIAAHLVDEGIAAFRIISEEGTFSVKITEINAAKDEYQWQNLQPHF